MKKQLLLSLLLVFVVKITCFAQTDMPSTETVMKAAYAQATKEHKNVMVIFHAS